VETTTERLEVTRELVIDASPETVWEFLVDPEKLRRWKVSDASFEARPGRPYRMEIAGEHVAAGEVVEADPPRRLVCTWGWEGNADVPPGSTTIEYELVAEGSATRLRFTHRDLPSSTEAEKHGHGWDHYFGRLGVAASGGDPGPDPWVSERSE
jgi:uncharacterized protein YndB with AHSA1/START domain